MFSTAVYTSRRKRLAADLGSGLLLFLGNEESPMNYTGNTFPFRQDSSFLYYFGLDEPGLASVIDVDKGETILFGTDLGVDDIIWTGPLETMAEKAKKGGVKRVEPMEKLTDFLQVAIRGGRHIHYLPPYRGSQRLRLGSLLGIVPQMTNVHSSVPMIKAVVAQRAVKSKEEIDEIEWAFDVTRDMYKAALAIVKAGRVEQVVVAAAESVVRQRGTRTSFPVICSVHGEVFHNPYYRNTMKQGNLLVLDGGAESTLHYATDVTRTYPVSGKYVLAQKDIYTLVLKAQEEAIAMMKPGLKFRDVHLHAAEVIADGLIGLGYMKGNTTDAVKEGAHALFFPHGLGHMMGLDVHDMEGLGENYVGYTDEIRRSTQFGLAYLRMARALEPGFVMTVEPGIYFVPELIDYWKKEKKCLDFINYDKVEKMKGFGGIRIEDDVLITKAGHRVLGKPIPKKVEEIEAAMKS